MKATYVILFALILVNVFLYGLNAAIGRTWIVDDEVIPVLPAGYAARALIVERRGDYVAVKQWQVSPTPGDAALRLRYAFLYRWLRHTPWGRHLKPDVRPYLSIERVSDGE